MMTLHRFRYSPYARKVELVLELLGVPFEKVEVPYGDRERLARLTGGYVHVPVLQDGDLVVVDSRRIVEHLLATTRGAVDLVPEGLEAACWALHDHVEGPVEDVLFRLASPGVQAAWPTAWERALYTLVKERRYGAGCVEAWRAERAGLLSRGREVLAPVSRTLERRPFVLGEAVTLGDCALYGQWVMLDEAEPGLLTELGAPFAAHRDRVDALRR